MARDTWRMGFGVVACFAFENCFFGAACLTCLGAARFTCCGVATVSHSVTGDTGFLSSSIFHFHHGLHGNASCYATGLAGSEFPRYLLGCLLEWLGWRLGGCLLQLRTNR